MLPALFPATTPPAPRVVGVVPDVDGYDAILAYIVPPELDGSVEVGTIVQAPLVGRSVRGWVVADPFQAPDGVELKALDKVRSIGPSAELVELAGWAVQRWLGKLSFYLDTASPPVQVKRLGRAAPAAAPAIADTAQAAAPAATPAWVTQALEGGSCVLRLAPATDPLPLLLAAHGRGPALIVVPTNQVAYRLARRLRALGCRIAVHPGDWAKAAAGGTTVIGTQTAAWATLPDVKVMVVLDAHDHLLQSQAAPTWHAAQLLAERARRLDIAAVLVSPIPRLEQLEHRRLVTMSTSEESHGWAPIHVVDQRTVDPRQRLYSDPLVKALRSQQRVVCVLNRKGRAQLLICSACQQTAACETCGSALAQHDELLRCKRCGGSRPVVCAHCGAGRMKALRLGVSRASEELEALAGRPVGEVTKESGQLPGTTVLVGTTAVLHRIGRADVVAFLDFDQELLAAQIHSGENALALLARASRLVGPRGGTGLVIVQTSNPHHEVLDAAVHGNPQRFEVVERQRRQELDWPPFSAWARISGESAAAFIGDLPRVVPATLTARPAAAGSASAAGAVGTPAAAEIVVLGPRDGTWLVQAPDHRTLSHALRSVPRPPGRLRIEVDPPNA